MVNNTLHIELLNEEATPQQVEDAINKRYEVYINYNSDNSNKGRGKRLIQPVAYGVNKSGNYVLRAFQPYGDTKTKTPHWKMFRVDKIESWKPLKRRVFQEPPSSQFGAIDGKYNPNGDKGMVQVICQADFEKGKQGQEKYQKSGLKKYNDARQQQKQEQDPFYKLKQNLKNAGRLSPEQMKNLEWDQQRKIQRQSAAQQNQQNTAEMSSITNFGDNKTQTTVGPINKNNIEQPTNEQPQNNLNYQNIQQNGPITKNTQQTTDNTETYDPLARLKQNVANSYMADERTLKNIEDTLKQKQKNKKENEQK